jgi:hypothetical protein
MIGAMLTGQSDNGRASAKWRLGLFEEGKIVFVIFPSGTISA